MCKDVRDLSSPSKFHFKLRLGQQNTVRTGFIYFIIIIIILFFFFLFIFFFFLAFFRRAKASAKRDGRDAKKNFCLLAGLFPCYKGKTLGTRLLTQVKLSCRNTIGYGPYMTNVLQKKLLSSVCNRMSQDLQ